MEAAPQLDAFLERELKRIARDGVVNAGEVICEVEIAAEGVHPGAFLVTTERVLLHSTPVLGQTTRVVSVPLTEIESVQPGTHRWIVRKRGKLRIEQRGRDPIEFRRIKTVERAQQLARTISRQRLLLENASGT